MRTPLERDVFLGAGSIEALLRHFGYRDREFPYMAKFVPEILRRIRCLRSAFIILLIVGRLFYNH
jgi:hypothetical protein